MDNKKLIKNIIIGSILITLILIGAYFYFTKPKVGDIVYDEQGNPYIFGETPADNNPDNTGNGDNIPYGGEYDDNGNLININKLRQITAEPTAGFVLAQDKDGDAVVKYIEKATGHIYETKLGLTNKKRISGTTLPRIQDAVWLDEKSLIIRYLDEEEVIKSFYAEIIAEDQNLDEKTDGKIEGVFLQDDIKELVKAGTKIFYLLVDGGGAKGIASDPDGENKEQIFISSLGEWLVQRPQKGFLTFTTKPSADVLGSLYFFDTNNENMKKILGGVRGLTTLANNDMTKVLFSENLKMQVYDVKENKSSNLLRTLAEKCVWSVGGVSVYCGVPIHPEDTHYPDAWYKGQVSFSDNIWKIDMENIFSESLTSDYFDIELDVIKPALSLSDDYLVFINKKDSSLWSLTLSMIEDVVVPEETSVSETTDVIAPSEDN